MGGVWSMGVWEKSACFGGAVSGSGIFGEGVEAGDDQQERTSAVIGT